GGIVHGFPERFRPLAHTRSSRGSLPLPIEQRQGASHVADPVQSVRQQGTDNAPLVAGAEGSRNRSTGGTKCAIAIHAGRAEGTPAGGGYHRLPRAHAGILQGDRCAGLQVTAQPSASSSLFSTESRSGRLS